MAAAGTPLLSGGIGPEGIELRAVPPGGRCVWGCYIQLGKRVGSSTAGRDWPSRWSSTVIHRLRGCRRRRGPAAASALAGGLRGGDPHDPAAHFERCEAPARPRNARGDDEPRAGKMAATTWLSCSSVRHVRAQIAARSRWCLASAGALSSVCAPAPDRAPIPCFRRGRCRSMKWRSASAQFGAGRPRRRSRIVRRRCWQRPSPYSAVRRAEGLIQAKIAEIGRRRPSRHVQPGAFHQLRASGSHSDCGKVGRLDREHRGNESPDRTDEGASPGARRCRDRSCMSRAAKVETLKARCRETDCCCPPVGPGVAVRPAAALPGARPVSRSWAKPAT